MRLALAALTCLALPASALAATIDNDLAMGCRELSTQQSIRLFARSGDGDGAEAQMRMALKSGSCVRLLSGERVQVGQRSGAFVCVRLARVPDGCLWVEAGDVKP